MKLSTSERGVIEFELLERRIRFMVRALDVRDLEDITERITGYRCPLFLVPSTDDLQKIYAELRKRVRVGDFVASGEASFDRIRRASDDMLRLVALIADMEDNQPYEHMAAYFCREELERRGVIE